MLFRFYIQHRSVVVYISESEVYLCRVAWISGWIRMLHYHMRWALQNCTEILLVAFMRNHPCHSSEGDVTGVFSGGACLFLFCNLAWIFLSFFSFPVRPVSSGVLTNDGIFFHVIPSLLSPHCFYMLQSAVWAVITLLGLMRSLILTEICVEVTIFSVLHV